MAEEKEISSFTCNICDSDVLIDDPPPKPGEVYYCSYCKFGFKAIKTKSGDLKFEAEIEE